MFNIHAWCDVYIIPIIILIIHLNYGNVVV